MKVSDNLDLQLLDFLNGKTLFKISIYLMFFWGCEL